jgi:Fe2+ transport system protein B
MTEFNKLGKQVDAAAKLLAEHEPEALSDRFSLAVVSKAVATVSKLKEDIDSYDKQCDKFVAKKDQRDEISGELRFGPNMCAKIDALSQQLKALLERCDHQQLVLEELRAEAEANQPLIVEEPSSMDIAVDEEQLAVEREAARQQELLELQAKAAAEEELHRRAEEARTKKTLITQERRQQLKRIIGSLNSFHQQYRLEDFVAPLVRVINI